MDLPLVAAATLGYLIGSIPTAGWLARLKGIDLLTEGSGNPGANNALRTGGAGLASAVLFVEMTKGASVAMLGSVLVGDIGTVVAGIAGATGNLYNLWYRFRGGKGLGITAGILLVAWPTVVLPVLVVIALGAWATRSTGGATVIAIAALGLAGLLWLAVDLPIGWGLGRRPLLLALAVGLGLLILPKHLPSARFRRSSPA
jgi:acyl phosphate:glycerol-3-phosphate acyltransferase